MVVEGLLFGLAYVVSPGPVAVETVRRSLLGGVRSALAVQLGAVAGDLVYVALAITGLGAFLLGQELRTWLGLLGSGLLILLGISAIRDSRAMQARLAPQAERGAHRGVPLARHFGAGVLLALLNPYAIVFWLSVGSAISGSAGALAGFAIGALVGSVLTALAAAKLNTGRRLRLARWIWSGCGGVLLLLGAQLGYSLISRQMV
jgi:threonine/homoserine/homoserine lactone efflux protein